MPVKPVNNVPTAPAVSMVTANSIGLIGKTLRNNIMLVVTSADLLTGMAQSGEADRRVHMTYEEAKKWLESGLAIVNAAIAERDETLN